ncbi:MULTISPECIES: HPF/RaiA family ribosome-associated protein [Candidatus Ichthyocystis]|uniref:Putative sigma 54 modulation protein / S30EA ribosomal protein n=1 Tax=Candidatus Ichthyocystis hellenicum TaxID=1561003 RepID=A0A0S4M035_9BURK|nr:MULTISPECIES: HPF/RaiA family ribosome-associated protein [Ichthyocystis]CUT17173.1 putative sigma 54 modulation protein / S30EA ribosomal protein [Candidatus Ichthyocystis hellenicum]
MEVIVFGKNIRTSRALKEFTEDRIIRAFKSIRHTVERVKVTLSKERDSRIAKIHCNIGGRGLAMQGEDDNIYGAVSVVASQLNKKIARETKKKRTEPRRASVRSSNSSTA